MRASLFANGQRPTYIMPLEEFRPAVTVLEQNLRALDRAAIAVTNRVEFCLVLLFLPYKAHLFLFISAYTCNFYVGLSVFFRAKRLVKKEDGISYVFWRETRV
jgi:hypothetical protein